MLTIRTTLSLPVHVHKKLKREALEQDTSLNDLLVQKITNKETDDLKKSFKRLEKLTKGINTKGIDYKELVNYGRKY